MLENTGGAIKNGQSRETGNTGYTRRRKTNTYHNRFGHHYTQTNTNNVNMTRALQQTTNWMQRRNEHRFYSEIVTDITTWNSERKDT